MQRMSSAGAWDFCTPNQVDWTEYLSVMLCTINFLESRGRLAGWDFIAEPAIMESVPERRHRIFISYSPSNPALKTLTHTYDFL